MSEVIKRLRDRRLNVWEQAKGLADSAAEENRAFTAEEQKQWDEQNAEIDALDRRIKAIVEGEQRAKDTEDAFAKLEGKPPEGGGKKNDPRGEELRAFLTGEQGSPRFFDVKPDGPVEFRDLSKLTGAAGGDIVPTSFYNRLVAHLIENSGVLQANPTVLNTASGESIEIPKTLTHPTAVVVLEAAGIPEGDPTFDKVALGAFKYGRMVQVSRELVTDSGVDLEGYLAMACGRALGNALGAHLVVGTGTGEPRGVTIDSSLGFTPAAGLLAGGGFGSQATADQGFDILINVFHSVISPYRQSRSCGWLMNDVTASRVRKIKSTEGVYAWQPSVVAGQPDTILSKPVTIDPNVASPGAGTKSIVFGDWSQYFVRFAGGIRFERSDDFAFGNDLVSFRALLRGDGALIDLTGAIKHLLHPAT